MPVTSTRFASHPTTMLALLVDRDPDTRNMYAEFLRIGHWEVDEAADGREALAKAIARHPDVIITETRLPGISGFDLCELLRRDAATRDIPILVVTGDASTPGIRNAKSSGADVVLTKPCLPDTLLNEMRRLVAETRAVGRRAPALGGNAAENERAQTLTERPRPADRKHSLSKAHLRRDTTAPPLPVPSLLCPSCDRQLMYQRSHIGGVSAKQAEQWDYFDCAAGCGQFQYRQRTRKLRRVG